MYLTKIITMLIFLMASTSNAYASRNFYMGAEYVHDVIKINKVDGMVTEEFDSDLNLSNTSRKSYKSGGVFIGYKFHSNFSIEMGYAQSKTEKKYFSEQGSLLFDGVSRISIKSYRIELLGSHAFPRHTNLSLLGSIGTVLSQTDIDVEYKEQVVCIALAGVVCPPYRVTNKDDVNTNIRMQYGIGAKYQLNKNISTRFMAKSILNGFSFSSGTPYSLELGVQYHF